MSVILCNLENQSKEVFKYISDKLLVENRLRAIKCAVYLAVIAESEQDPQEMSKTLKWKTAGENEQKSETNN